MIKNKRGDISVTLLVFMSLFLAGFTLISFVNNKANIDASIGNPLFIEKSYLQESQINFYLKQAGERALAKSYYDMANEGSFGEKIDSGTSLKNFDEESFDNLLKDRFITNFKSEVERYDFKAPVLQKFKQNIEENKFDLTVKGESVSLEVKDTQIIGNLVIKKNERIWVWLVVPTLYDEEKIPALIGVIYRPKIMQIFRFNHIGLTGFGELYSYSQECLKEKEFENCLSGKLTNYHVKVSEQNKEKAVSIESKDSFFIDRELKKISVNFVI